MPANPRRLFEPRPLLDARRADDVRLPDEDLLRPPADLERLAVRRDADVEDRPDCPRDLAERDERVRLEPERLALDRLLLELPVFDLPDFLVRCDLVSPFSRRILLTVRAATSSARPP
jgi:hypothetical protein